MPVGNLMCVVRFLFTNFLGEVERHTLYRRVSSGREGIKVRDELVSLGASADTSVFITECRLIEL